MGQGLAEKVTLVTGEARGIGLAIALRQAANGTVVVVSCAGSAQQA